MRIPAICGSDTHLKAVQHQDVGVSTGYAHPGYAASLAEFGTPRHLERSDGWILERAIGDSPYRDGMGPYPLFFCADWGRLGEDLDDLAADLVSVVLVTDPFADTDISTLSRSFGHVARYKDHYVADLEQPIDSFVSSSHRARARSAAHG